MLPADDEAYQGKMLDTFDDFSSLNFDLVCFMISTYKYLYMSGKNRGDYIMGLKKIAISTFVSVFALCSMNTVVFAENSYDYKIYDQEE